MERSRQERIFDFNSFFFKIQWVFVSHYLFVGSNMRVNYRKNNWQFGERQKFALSSGCGFVAQWLERPTGNLKTQVWSPAGFAVFFFLSDSAVSSHLSDRIKIGVCLDGMVPTGTDFCYLHTAHARSVTKDKKRGNRMRKGRTSRSTKGCYNLGSHATSILYATMRNPNIVPPGNRLLLTQILRLEGVTRKKKNVRKRQRERGRERERTECSDSVSVCVSKNVQLCKLDNGTTVDSWGGFHGDEEQNAIAARVLPFDDAFWPTGTRHWLSQTMTTSPISNNFWGPWCKRVRFVTSGRFSHTQRLQYFSARALATLHDFLRTAPSTMSGETVAFSSPIRKWYGVRISALWQLIQTGVREWRLTMFSASAKKV